MKIKPLGDRILIESLSEEERTKKTKYGIVIPETAEKEKPQEGKVVAVGHGRLLEDGTIKSLEVKSGDKVLYGKYSGTEVKVDGEEYLILKEEDVLAVVKD